MREKYDCMTGCQHPAVHKYLISISREICCMPK